MAFKGPLPSILIKFMLIMVVILSCRERIETDRKVKHIVLIGLDAFFEEQPDFLFLNIYEIDHFGQQDGHDSEAYFIF
jgi:hypothetical protein